MSTHKFTRRQLMTCLVLRAFTKNTYRGIIELLETSGQLRRILCMERLPHYSTLKKFADRTVIPEILEFMLQEILREVGDTSDEVALDSTGLETSPASAHYVSRSGRARQQYVKVSASVTCKSMLAAGLVVGRGLGRRHASTGAFCSFSTWIIDAAGAAARLSVRSVVAAELTSQGRPERLPG